MSTALSTVTMSTGVQVPVALLDTLDLNQLEIGNVGEIKRLLRAAQGHGLFYLDLGNSEQGRKGLRNLQDVYSTTQQYFDQPHDLKVKDMRYKDGGCDETFEMAYDELVPGTCNLPYLLRESEEKLREFSTSMHTACLTMLSCLSDGLNLQGADRFEYYHRPGEISDSGLKLVYEPSLERLENVKENKHTDSGTLTLLFYDLWGLHAELAEGWAFAPPKPPLALVNVADSLKRLSRMKFHSPIHRVTQPTDGFEKRYYISYFLRPEQQLKMSWMETGEDEAIAPASTF
ncbi:hypothetical protein F4813DRAFT_389450 [Daldinia decipiens]|uniref:uncharacterized protein n=1 Tax=Daldinia decipiens TaxID=326647 RepID=UPI0020C1F8CE|nr:uncharacterized protein F4813DRAFT_389450 [Daldinia decipiens]KAI1657714.1 hypothetical protein F4813DRAFT_389450 [Daldinia decipiens]